MQKLAADASRMFPIKWRRFSHICILIGFARNIMDRTTNGTPERRWRRSNGTEFIFTFCVGPRLLLMSEVCSSAIFSKDIRPISRIKLMSYELSVKGASHCEFMRATLKWARLDVKNKFLQQLLDERAPGVEMSKRNSKNILGAIWPLLPLFFGSKWQDEVHSQSLFHRASGHLNRMVFELLSRLKVLKH